jgi:hypothetical protein
LLTTRACSATTAAAASLVVKSRRVIRVEYNGRAACFASFVKGQQLALGNEHVFPRFAGDSSICVQKSALSSGSR